MHGTVTDGRSRAADLAFFRPPPPTEGGPSAALVPPEPWAMRVGKHIQPIVNRIVAHSSLVADRALPDAIDFPWVAVLEREWRTIRDEATAALSDLSGVPPLADISPDHRDIAPGDQWRSLFLYGYGYRDDANCRACPQT
ncbi:MAG: aspartyl/asparaginyl beta-hydroxylase domain-containing protein, partial [Sphingomonadales bacterium]